MSILGLDGAEMIGAYAAGLNDNNVDYIEALAARDYFQYYSAGLNRRCDDPINSRLNYGYAILRTAIARSLVMAGFHTAFGIHHNNQFNPFNLADDFIEPFRPVLDMLVHQNIASNVRLTPQDRRVLSQILYMACSMNHSQMSVLAAIQSMVESYKRILLHETTEALMLPTILPTEFLPGVTE